MKTIGRKKQAKNQSKIKIKRIQSFKILKLYKMNSKMIIIKNKKKSQRISRKYKIFKKIHLNFIKDKSR